jgi:TP901 family phage tail tape measure protein
MAKRAGTIDIGINVPAAEIRKAETQLKSLFNTSQSFNKNPINSKSFTQPLGRITGAANEFNKSLEASNARVIAFGASAGAIFAVQSALQQLVRTTITVEQQLTNISVLLNETDKNFAKFSDGLYKTAKATGQSFADVATSAEELARQGLNVNDTLKRNQSAMILSKLGAMDVKNATDSLTAAMYTFGKAAGDSTQIVNKLAQVDAAFAVSSGDLAEAIKRTGAAAVSANVSFEELISVVTVAQEKTARGGSVIGNSFKTIFTRIQRPETLRQLKDLGVVVQDSNRQMLPAIQILKNYAKVYDTLAPTLKATSAEQLAGVFQVNVLKAVLPDLASAYGRYDKALNIANNTTNEATERMKLLVGTSEGALNATSVNLTKFASEVGNLTVKPALDRILSMINSFADLISPKNFFGLGEKVGEAVYQGMGKIIEGPGLALLGVVLVKIGAKLSLFVKDAAAGFMGMESASQKLAATQNIIQNVLAERPKLIQQATASEEGMVAVARILAEKIKASRVEMERLKTAANAAAPAVLAMSGSGGTGKGRKAAGGFRGFAGGFVPNFNMAAQERRLAEAGGYQAGKIKQATIPGVGKVTYNGNEQVKQMPGLEQPAIMPPALSNAGRNYRDAFRGAHGYDPYNMGSGFVPNFAPMVKLSSLGQTEFGGKKELAQSSVTKYYKKGDFKDAWLAQDSGYNFSAQKAKKDHRDKMTGTRDSAFTHIFDTQGKIGLLGFAGDYTSRSASARMKIKDISAMKELRERVPGLANDMMVFENVQVSNISQMHRMQKSKKKPFFDRISDFLAQPLANLADSFSQELLGNQGKLDTKAIASQLSGQNSLMPPGTEGDIFEAVLRIMTTQPTHLRKAFDSQRNFRAPFDFEEGANVGATPKFKESFGFDTRRYLKADAKRSATQDTINSLVKKGINQFILNPQGKFASMFQNVPGMSSGSGIAAGVSGGKQFISERERSQAAKRVGNLKGKALGFVPNFAAVGSKLGAEQSAAEIRAVSNAVSRENQAGVPRNQIRVGTDKRLGGGVGVFNTSEGSLAHAIDMHMSRGANMRDIQTMGKAMGFVPNFAGASMSTRVIPPSSAPAGAAPNAQVNAQLESAANKVNETSMMMSMGLMMAGGQLAAYSERLRAANEGVANFGSTVTNIAAQTAMYAPVIQMATSSMGGIAGGFNKLNSSILAGQVAMGGWITSLRAGSAANAVSGGTGLGARIMGTKASGAFMKGKATRGFGDIFGSVRSGYGASRAAGGTRLAALTAGGKSAAAGGGLMGGAAGALLSPVGIAAGVGALAYGGAKLHGSIKNKEINKSGVDLAESTKRTADQYSKLNTVMDSASAAAQKYAEALQKGDKAAADSAKRELLGTVAGGGRALDAMIGKQGVKAGGKTFKSSSEVMNRLRDADISPEEIQELLGGIKSASAKTASMSKAAGDVSSLFDTFVKNQTPIMSTDMGAGQLEAAAIGLGVAMEGINKDALAKVKEEAGFLGDTIENVTDGIGGIITYNEGQELATRMKALVEATGNLTPQQKALAVRLGQLGSVAHMNENELHRLAKEVLKEFQGQIKDATARIEELGKPLEQSKKQIFDLYKSSRKLSKSMSDQAKDFAFASKLEKLMTDSALKMFDVGTKTLSSALGQTASELSNIEFKNMAELQRLELRTQQQVQEEYRATQQKLSSAVTSVIGSQLNQVKQGGDEVFGLQGKEFTTVVENGFVPAIEKAIANADFDGADDAIKAAIKGLSVPDGTAKKVFDDIQLSVNDARRSSVEATKLDREQLKTQKELINAQREAAIQQLKLANEINFAGGVGGGGGAPQKAIERVLSNNLNMRRGFAMGDNDLQTGALLDQIKVLNTLKVGAGPNPANAATQVLTDQIETNLKQFLAGTGLAGNFSPADIKEIAQKQAKAAIKPDVTLDDLKTVLDKNKYEGDSLKVHVTNIDGPATNTNNGQAAPGGGFNLRGINEVIRAHNEAMDTRGEGAFRLKPIPMNPDGTFKGPRGAAGTSGPAGVPGVPPLPMGGAATPTSKTSPLQRYRELIERARFGVGLGTGEGDFRNLIGGGMVSDEFFNSFLSGENLLGDANRKLSLQTMDPKVNKTKQQQERDRIQFLQKRLTGGLSSGIGAPDRGGIGLGLMSQSREIGMQGDLLSSTQHRVHQIFKGYSPEKQQRLLTPQKPNQFRSEEGEKNRVKNLKESLRVGAMIDRLAKMGLVNLDDRGLYQGFKDYGGVKVPGHITGGTASGTQGMKFLTERQAALQKVVSGETTGRGIISKEQAKKELDLTNKVILELKEQNNATRDLIENAKKELKLLQEQALDRGMLSKAKEAAERSLQAFQKMGLDRASAGANEIGKLLQTFSEAKQRGQSNKIDIDMAGSEAKLNAMISKALSDDKLTKSELKEITTAFNTETNKIKARTDQFILANKTGGTLLSQNQANIGPIEAALRQFEITFANKNIVQSFTRHRIN